MHTHTEYFTDGAMAEQAKKVSAFGGSSNPMTTYTPIFRDEGELAVSVGIEAAIQEITGYDYAEGPVAFLDENGVDVSRDVALHWLKTNGQRHYDMNGDDWPEFIGLHAAPEAYDIVAEGTNVSDEEYRMIHDMLVSERQARQGATS